MTNLITKLAQALGLSEGDVMVEIHSGLTKICVDLDRPYEISMVGVMVEIIRDMKLAPVTIDIMYGATTMASIEISRDGHDLKEFFNV